MGRILRNTILTLSLAWLSLSGQGSYTGTLAFGSPEEKQDSAGVQGLQSRILYSLLDLQLERADSMLEYSWDLSGDSPSFEYFEAYREFLNALIEGDAGSMETCLGDNGRRLENLKELADSHPESYALMSTLYLQSSLLSAYLGENFRAAKHYFFAYRTLNQGEEKNPGDPMNYRNRGIITLIAASVPEEYAWMFRILGIRGDLLSGMGYLREYRSASRGAEGLEADLLQRLADYSFRAGDLTEWDSTAIAGREAATLTRFVEALEALGAGRSDAVLELLGNYRQEEGEKDFPYLDLLLGEAMLNGLDTAALLPLQRFADRYRGKHYRQYVWHKIAWCYAIRGEWDRYRDAGQEVLNSGSPYLDADVEALSETLDSLSLNPDLLKARLLFDGGYYHRALEALGVPGAGISPEAEALSGKEKLPNAIPLRNRKDTLEYVYRLGRIYDRLGERDAAMRYYERVIRSDPERDWYFAPNSALHLGLMAEESGDPEMALEYYRKCLRINRSAYKRSIDYKARQGIRRMESLQKLR